MVKPSKSMQPEHVDLQQAAKRTGTGAAFGEDSFRNYMALKIATQRKQFGLVLPPPPPNVASKQKAANQQDAVQKSPNRKRLRPNASTLTNQPASSDNPTSRGVLRSSRNSAAEPPSSAINKRPTLLDRIPSSQIAHEYYSTKVAVSPARSTTKSHKATSPSDRSVRFADQVAKPSHKQPHKKTKMESVISRLKKRHGRGNRRLEQKTTKKRKRETRSENQIDDSNSVKHDKTDLLLESFTQADAYHETSEKEKMNTPLQSPPKPEDKEASSVEMDPPQESPKQEGGLEELNKLFAIAEENDLEFGGKSEEQNSEKSEMMEEEATRPTVTTPVSSVIGAEEKKLTPTMGDGLAELNKMFAAAEAPNDDDSSLSYCNNVSKSEPQEKQGSLTELDQMFSTAEVAKHDDDFFCFETDQPEENNKASPEKQQKIATAADTMDFSSTSDEEEEEAEESSTQVAPPPSPKSIRRLRPDLFFYGVVVKVAGYTHPDNETLKRLLQKHGGDLETYETERVTHIIAQQLSTAKANVYKKARRPRPVCRPSWIVDSVREGKLLPHGEYLLIEERDQQQMGIQSMFKKQTEARKKDPPKPSTLPSSPQKSAVIHKNPYAKKNKDALSPEKRGVNISVVGGNPYTKKNSTTYSPEKQDGNSSAVDEAAQFSAIGHDHDSNRSSPGKTDKRLINGKVRTVGTDPNFLDSYFASSRLSFIGSFKQRASSANISNGNGSCHPLSNSKKLIFHVDMDCFFAAVVLRNYPQYQDKPVVISHHGNRSDDQRKDEERGNNASVGNIPKNSHSECATCNYEARKYGIKKGMFLGRAKELCPELIVLMYDFEGYEEVSQQVSEILDRLASSESHPGVVETVSCDEAYVELNFDSSEDSKELYDHAFELAESVRNEIFETTRCTASIGVGENKFLAKLGTDKAKPNKSYCVRDYRELLKDLSLRDMHGVGWRTEKKLTEEGLVTVQDVWDLGSRGETELIRILGPGTGKKIYRFTQGIDDRPFMPVERKTIGAECNYGVRFDGPYGIDHFMEGLAKEVEKRMEGISMKGKKITLKIKQRKKGASNRHKFLGHGSCHNLSKSILIPGNVATRDSKIFTKIGLSLFKEFGISDIHEVRGMGIVISSLEADNYNGKQTNTSGMQNWLQQSSLPETVKNREVSKDAIISKEYGSEPAAMTNDIVPFTPNRDESNITIQLPPMSQIRMSQVKALPPELQKEVRSRLNKDVAYYSPEEEMLQETTGPGIAEDRSVEESGTQKLLFGEESPSGNINVWQSTPLSMEEIGNDEESQSNGKAFKSIESPLMIELPPMSQIQMSQVEALPDDLKEQVYSRMNRMADENEPEVVDMTVEDPLPIQHRFETEQQQHSANRFRQTDLKRMMKLAAVRSGREKTNISLTQLEQLPLEIKLQVVNGDNRQIGVLSQHQQQQQHAPNRNRFTAKFNSATNHASTSSPKSSRNRLSTNHANTTMKEQKARDVNSIAMNHTTATVETETNVPPPPQQQMKKVFRMIDRVDVYKEDLLPLREFLNDNCPIKYPKSMDMVLEFLSIVLKEGRLPAMVTMIRCIRNRQDAWSKLEVVERIAQTMNDLHMKQYGSSLDVAWLMGMEE